MEQKVIYRTTEYKKYLRSLRYLGMPIFLLVVAAGNIAIFSFGIYYSIEKNKDVLLISIVAGVLGIVCIGLIVFFYFIHNRYAPNESQNDNRRSYQNNI